MHVVGDNRAQPQPRQGGRGDDVRPSAAFADAAATAIGNRVKGPDDVERVVEEERERAALAGLVIVAGDRMGAFGEVEFV